MKKLLRNRWFRFGWPVLFLIVIQAVIVWTLPAVKSWMTQPLRLGIFAAVDLILAGLQWWSYRQARLFARRMADLFEGRCMCDLYWDEFPCKIHAAKPR